MLYLEDFLELIEHLPHELRDRFTEVRENDLQVSNSSFQIDAKVKQFFAQADKLSAEQRTREYENILNDYQKTLEHADYKIQLVDQTHDIMTKLNQKLDDEIEKFKLELEADRAGISLGNNIGFNLLFNWYCTCRQVSYGAMVACDNEECEIEWFHYDCVGITQPPEGEWYCSECTKKMSSINHPTTNGHHQTQTHKKHGRKEMIAN